ncbi:MAG: sigma-70 family RNA polymerase sigma factor [Rikenellaceae bacterium]
MTKENFKILFDENFDSLRNFVYYRCSDTEVATDIAQEVFMKVWERQVDKPPKEVVPLLYKIARDTLVSRYRHEEVKKRFYSEPPPNDHHPSPDEELQYEELRANYEEALRELPEGQREVFLMSRNDELTYNEIAQRLELSVKAIEKRMRGALHFLRVKLQRE